ncbi:hypothetical protein ACSBPU_21510 [Parapusillimonas sp. JC17]|uniref:hypothetical protein n=1 Tax=Parapusillimonas sp. JC17 TaxID=3445768 RepID=UPI003FA0F2C7
MKSLVRVLKQAVRSGSSASLASGLALLAGGASDCRSAMAPVNAVSHWIWDEKALRQHRGSLRYSASGYAIHHLASIFWALFYESLAHRRNANPTKTEALASGAAIAAVACFVDLRCTPKRLTPGFERRLSTKSLVMVYAAFGIGLALHGLFRNR